MNQPIVSVIVLTHNSQKWLKQCLDSLMRQTIVDQIQIIVADNDSSFGYGKLPPKVELIQNGGNLGYCDGNNRAVSKAKGKYVLFLNPDTEMSPTCIEKMVARAERANAVAVSPKVVDLCSP